MLGPTASNGVESGHDDADSEDEVSPRRWGLEPQDGCLAAEHGVES